MPDPVDSRGMWFETLVLCALRLWCCVPDPVNSSGMWLETLVLCA